MNLETGRSRVVIEGVRPQIDCGAFPVKRIVGDNVVIEADVFTDGHDAISVVLLSRQGGAPSWRETPMAFLNNDRWRASFLATEVGRYEYTVLAWVDRFKSWARDMAKRVEAGQETPVDLAIGAELVETAAARADEIDQGRLLLFARSLREGGTDAARHALSAELADLMARHAERLYATRYDKVLAVEVNREVARFGAWYEMFPRSCAPEPGRHGTFRDVEARLPYVAAMGFDVLYLPPIHPIGRSFRKGRNNNVVAQPDDPGSPWAIGAEEGGHKAIHSELGTLDDFQSLRRSAADYGLELAMDIAFQCAPDHPYVKEHPAWFRHRPDGTIQYAENPPKKYQDIYPFDFESEDWQGMWEELKSIFLFWCEQGIRIFRVDNPHTKAFGFWHWVIGEVKREYPGAIFLSEAFTRPKVMYRLAKLGFTQSYNYFPWRNTKREITEYLTELTQTEVREYFTANLWPNTPDILPEYLQFGGPPAFVTRFVLAATLGPAYGIYGPAYELYDDEPLAPGKEEYLDSEKYEIRQWDIDRPDSLRDLIARVNACRRENKALQSNANLRFQKVDNDQIIAFTKATDDGSNQVLVVVNLDPHHAQAGILELELERLGVAPDMPYQMHDLLTDARYLWNGPRNYVALDPKLGQAHIFVIRRRIRTEHDFDYYM
ncbi:MAG: alpha-1,4-glucan--maltose-1-phosphate maltosyltransferase [Anaerolineae bacterium]